MGLKEILAAKKAAAEKAEKENSNEAKKEEVQSIAPADTKTESVAVPQPVENVAKAEEVLVDANGKPLSGFALVKRRKELAAHAALAPVVEKAKEEKIEGKPVEPFNAQFIEKIQEPIVNEIQDIQSQTGQQFKEIVQEALAIPETADYSHESYIAANPETKQAYSDIKQRIDALVSLSDLDLKTAMTELKKSLMQNTNAVALMLPSDIGQMVIALRKMTGVELAKAEEKKTGKKAGKGKEVMLSADALEEAFKEL